jgi:hypothetical protein
MVAVIILMALSPSRAEGDELFHHTELRRAHLLVERLRADDKWPTNSIPAMWVCECARCQRHSRCMPLHRMAPSATCLVGGNTGVYEMDGGGGWVWVGGCALVWVRGRGDRYRPPKHCRQAGSKWRRFVLARLTPSCAASGSSTRS